MVPRALLSPESVVVALRVGAGTGARGLASHRSVRLS